MKYMFCADCSFLNKKKKHLLLIFLIPIIVFLIFMNSKMSFLNIVTLSFGCNLNINNVDVIMLIMFLYNLFSFGYLISSLYVKDFDNLENIFLRINSEKYIIIKELVFFSLIFIFKLVQYTLAYIIFIIVRGFEFDIDIIYLFFDDLLYISVICLVIIFIFSLYFLLNKNIYLLLIFLIILCISFPKNIICIRNSTLILFICFIVLLLNMIKFVFRKKYYKIMEGL